MTLEFEPFSVSLSQPLETAAGSIETRDGFVVRTEIDGVTGVGEATPLAGWTEPIEACERALDRVEDPIAALETDRLSGAPAARHGVSLAILDARARRSGRPLYDELGRTERVESVPVNATIGDGGVEETVAAVERAAEEGYPAVKLKVGARALETDLERLEAARSSCPEIELRVDANGGWERATAEKALSELASLGVSVLEQPLPAAQLSAHAALRGQGVEIALDEGLIEHGVSAALVADAADLIVCKPMALGGIDVAREAVFSARDRGIDALITTTIDAAHARAAAVHLAASIPDIRACGLATGGLLEADLRNSIAEVADGAVAVPQGKGNIPPR